MCERISFIIVLFTLFSFVVANENGNKQKRQLEFSDADLSVSDSAVMKIELKTEDAAKIQDGEVEEIKITRKIPFPVPVTVEKRVPVAVPVPVDHPFPVYIPKPVPYAVHKPFPIPVKIPVTKPFISDHGPIHHSLPIHHQPKLPPPLPKLAHIKQALGVAPPLSNSPIALLRRLVNSIKKKFNPIVHAKVHHHHHPPPKPVIKHVPVPYPVEKVVPVPVEVKVPVPYKVKEYVPVNFHSTTESVKNPHTNTWTDHSGNKDTKNSFTGLQQSTTGFHSAHSLSNEHFKQLNPFDQSKDVSKIQQYYQNLFHYPQQLTHQKYSIEQTLPKFTSPITDDKLHHNNYHLSSTETADHEFAFQSNEEVPPTQQYLNYNYQQYEQDSTVPPEYYFQQNEEQHFFPNNFDGTVIENHQNVDPSQLHQSPEFVQYESSNEPPKYDSLYHTQSSNFDPSQNQNIFMQHQNHNIFEQPQNSNIFEQHQNHNIFEQHQDHNMFEQPRAQNSFEHPQNPNMFEQSHNDNIFEHPQNHNVFEHSENHNIFEQHQSHNSFDQSTNQPSYEQPHFEYQHQNINLETTQEQSHINLHHDVQYFATPHTQYHQNVSYSSSGQEHEIPNMNAYSVHPIPQPSQFENGFSPSEPPGHYTQAIFQPSQKNEVKYHYHYDVNVPKVYSSGNRPNSPIVDRYHYNLYVPMTGPKRPMMETIHYGSPKNLEYTTKHVNPNELHYHVYMPVQNQIESYKDNSYRSFNNSFEQKNDDGFYPSFPETRPFKNDNFDHKKSFDTEKNNPVDTQKGLFFGDLKKNSSRIVQGPFRNRKYDPSHSPGIDPFQYVRYAPAVRPVAQYSFKYAASTEPTLKDSTDKTLQFIEDYVGTLSFAKAMPPSPPNSSIKLPKSIQSQTAVNDSFTNGH